MEQSKNPESPVAGDVRSAIASLHRLYGAGVRQITPDQHRVQVENIRSKIADLINENDPSAEDLARIYNINLAISEQDKF